MAEVHERIAKYKVYVSIGSHTTGLKANGTVVAVGENTNVSAIPGVGGTLAIFLKS